MSIRYIFYGLLIMYLVVASSSGALLNRTFDTSDVVIVNQTFSLSDSQATPFLIWAAAGYLGIILLILSFFSFPNGEEGLLSILAWIPLAFTMFTSFSVDIVNGSGFTGSSGVYVLLENHTIYSFRTIAILFFIMLVFAFGNTYRIWANQKKFVEVSKPEDKETFT
jgi:hypothetical protein